MSYLVLAAAICAEVMATMSLRASEGFSRPGYVAIMIMGYVAAFFLLSLALERGISLGVAYGIWAAAGIAAVAILSVPLFGESFNLIQAGGLSLITLGVLVLELGTSHG